MMKSKKTVIAVIICAILAGCALISYFKFKNDKIDDLPGKNLLPQDEEPDYLDDLDAPSLPDKGERLPSRVRRGYIPIRLGRE